MLGPLEDTLKSPELPASEKRKLEVAHRNSLRLLRLVNTLLDFSRIEAGRTEASYEPVDVAQLTAEFASSFHSAIERAGLSFDVRCRATASAVFVDHDMWEKVVLNLLSNAFKFTLEGGVTVELEERDGFAELSVRDTGVGIPPEEVPHVFERFHRVKGTEGRTHEGTGIGLALVTELVKLHGGAVGVVSELGRGSTFTVKIPTGTAHLPPERIRAKRRLASTSLGAAPFVEEALRWLPGSELDVERESSDVPIEGVTTRGARVLVADDNADMRGSHAIARQVLDRRTGRQRGGGLGRVEAAAAGARPERRDDAPPRRDRARPRDPGGSRFALASRHSPLGAGRRGVPGRGRRLGGGRLRHQAVFGARAHGADQCAPRDGPRS
jgi:hypothetical protein